jgi:hypothetical protein
MPIRKCFIQLFDLDFMLHYYLTSVRRRVLSREIILRFQILAGVVGRDDNARAKVAFLLREQRVF